MPRPPRLREVRRTNADAIIWLGRRYRRTWAASASRSTIYTRGLSQAPAATARLLRHRGHRYLTVREIRQGHRRPHARLELIRGTRTRSSPTASPTRHVADRHAALQRLATTWAWRAT